jgi:hypothetical protein
MGKLFLKLINTRRGIAEPGGKGHGPFRVGSVLEQGNFHEQVLAAIMP